MDVAGSSPVSLAIFFVFFYECVSAVHTRKTICAVLMNVSSVSSALKNIARGSSSTGQSATLSRWMLRVRVPSLSPFFYLFFMEKRDVQCRFSLLKILCKKIIADFFIKVLYFSQNGIIFY